MLDENFETLIQDGKYKILTKDGKYIIATDAGVKRSKLMTRRELDNAIKRSSSAVRVAEAVGEEVDPLFRMLSKQPISNSTVMQKPSN